MKWDDRVDQYECDSTAQDCHSGENSRRQLVLLQSEGAGKQGETEVAPSAGEVSYLLCRWCRKASKAPREGRGSQGCSVCSDKEGTGEEHQNPEKLSDSCSHGLAGQRRWFPELASLIATGTTIGAEITEGRWAPDCQKPGGSSDAIGTGWSSRKGSAAESCGG